MSEVRILKIPEPITVTIVNPENEKEKKSFLYTFEKFVMERTADPEFFGKTLDDVLVAVEVREALCRVPVGTVVRVRHSAWERLCSSVRSPSGRYFPDVMVQILAFPKCILEAPAEVGIG